MFKSKTLFVLGAGSSNEISFPLGSELKGTIAQELKFKFDHFMSSPETGDRLICEALLRHADMVSGDKRAVRQAVIDKVFPAASKIARGMAQAPSIDNYLEAHAEDEEILLCGKLAIARAILLAEGSSLFQIDKSYPDRIDQDAAANTWYGKLFQLLATSVTKRSLESLLQNVSFISFNYDRSLERYLPLAIDNYYHCGLGDACDLVRRVKIFHPYGVCGNLPWQSSESVPFGGSDYSPELLSVADKIQTFSEQITDEVSLNEMKDEVAAASTIVFLGFGFHEMNMNLLSVPAGEVKRVFGTAKGLSSSDVAVVQKRLVRALRPFSTFDVSLSSNLRCVDFFDEYRFSLVA